MKRSIIGICEAGPVPGRTGLVLGSYEEMGRRLQTAYLLGKEAAKDENRMPEHVRLV